MKSEESYINTTTSLNNLQPKLWNYSRKGRFVKVYSMCAQVYRKPRETIPSLIRRFSRAVQSGKILEKTKSKLFNYRKPSERQIKQRAIMREALKELRKRLEKQSKYTDELFQREKKKIKEKFGF